MRYECLRSNRRWSPEYLPLRHSTRVVCALTAIFWCSTAGAGRLASEYHEVNLEVASPHVAWATPLSGGPIRVLFIAPRATLRDVAELAQRIEMEYEVVALWDSRFPGCDPRQQHWLPEDAAGEAVLARWSKLLDKDFDVIVLGNMSLTAVPEALQQRLIDRVAEGVGLVTACLRDGDTMLERRLAEMEEDEQRHLIAHGIGPLQPGEPGQTTVLLTSGTLDEGRVALLSYPGDPPRTHFAAPRPGDPLRAEQAYLENAYSLAARALRWAARRDGPVYVSKLHNAASTGPDRDEIPPFLPKEFVAAATTPAAHGLLHPFVLELDRPAESDYTVVAEVRRPGDRRREALTDQTTLRKGSQWFWLDLPAGPGEYWVDVWLMDRTGVVDWYTSPVRLEGWPTFSDLRLSKNHLLPHDALEVQCTVPATLWRGKPSVILARGVDSLDRVVAESAQTFSNDGGVVSLRLGFADLLAPLVRIEVYAVESEAAGRSERQLRTAFRESVWLPVRRRIDLSAEPRLVTMAEHLGEFNERFRLRQLAREGVDMVHTPGGVPALMEAARTGLSLIPQVTDLGPTTVLNGHERQPCLSDPDYLQSMVTDVQEGVLRHWAGGSGAYSLGPANCLSATEETVCWAPACRTAFTTAVPEARTETDCPQPGTAYWTRFAHFMDGVFTRAHAAAGQEVRRLDPAGQVGFVARAGEPVPVLDYDWAGLAETVDFIVAPASDVIPDRLRDAGCTPGLLCETLLPGTEANGPYLAWLPWFAVLHQAPTVWIPNRMGTANSAGPRAMLLPDGRLTPDMAVFLTDARLDQWKEIGALLLRAEAADPSILIYSSRANYLSQNAAGPPTTTSERAMSALVTNLGYTCRWVDWQKLDAASPGKQPVLVLPGMSMLSDAEVGTIRRFVDSGGKVLADTLPGAKDEVGRDRTQLPLADVFDENGPGMLLDSENGADQTAVAAWLADAGCEPVARTPKGEPVTLDGTVRRFRYGDAEILACLASPSATGKQKLQIAFPRDCEVHDLLTGLPVSRAKRVRLSLAPGEVKVYSAMPGTPTELALHVPEVATAGKRLPVVFDLRARKALAGEFLVRLTVATPDGTPLKHYSQILACKEGLGDLFVPLALSEPGGFYTIAARELLTGLSAQARVRVLPHTP